jgi:ankyrin repeat protein
MEAAGQVDANAMCHPFVSEVVRGNRAAVGRLISRGTSMNRPVRHSDGGLHNLLGIASQLGHGDVVILVLDHGAAIDARDYHGDTALFIVAQENHVTVVRRLLDRRASVNLPKISTVTSWFRSCYFYTGRLVKSRRVHPMKKKRNSDQ